MKRLVILLLVLVVGIVGYNLLYPPSVPLHSPDRLDGLPTVSAAFIDTVLAHAHSPARGQGVLMYQEGLHSHVDPVYALAFFHHESSYGLAGVATFTHSLGNIRCSAGYACYAGYRFYSMWAAGIADWYHLIAHVYIAHGLNTVALIIPVYAPAADHNNEAAYIASVRADVTRWREGQVNA